MMWILAGGLTTITLGLVVTWRATVRTARVTAMVLVAAGAAALVAGRPSAEPAAQLAELRESLGYRCQAAAEQLKDLRARDVTQAEWLALSPLLRQLDYICLPPTLHCEPVAIGPWMSSFHEKLDRLILAYDAGLPCQ